MIIVMPLVPNETRVDVHIVVLLYFSRYVMSFQKFHDYSDGYLYIHLPDCIFYVVISDTIFALTFFIIYK